MFQVRMYVIVALVMMMARVWADEVAAPSAAASPVVQEQAAIPEPPAPSPEAEKASVPIADSNALVSLDFQDADIRNVIKVLAFKSGVNIVPGPDVGGTVTIQLTDVPWQKALEVILSTYGFGYERKGNIVTVMTIENLKKHREDSQVLQDQEPLVTRTYVLNFAKAADVVESMNKVKTARGSVNFDQRTNVLIVRDVDTNLELLEEVVKALDSVTPQVLIEAKVVETGITDTDKMGIDWTVGASATGSKRPTSLPFVPRDQSNKFLPSTFGDPASSAFSFGTLSATQMTATLEMLSTRSNTNVLSNPTIVTLDNQAAKIVVGSKYPIPTYTYNSEQAKLQVSGWDYKDIGIIFDVTPHVNNAGMVTLELAPKITAIMGFVTVEGTSLPQLSTEEATTKVMVKDGQTLVIAGLIKDEVLVTKKKVPLLGDIPLVSEFFKKNSTTKTKTELLIFLTPHIITIPSPSSVDPKQK